MTQANGRDQNSEGPRLSVMRVMVEFMKTMFVNGAGLVAWVSLLLLANMVVPLFFLATSGRLT